MLPPLVPPTVELFSLFDTRVATYRRRQRSSRDGGMPVHPAGSAGVDRRGLFGSCSLIGKAAETAGRGRWRWPWTGAAASVRPDCTTSMHACVVSLVLGHHAVVARRVAEVEAVAPIGTQCPRPRERRGRRRQRRYRQLLSVGRAATATVAFSDALAFSRRREPEPRPVAATREGRHALLPCVYVVAIGCVIQQRRQRWPKRRGRRRSRRNGGDGGRGPSSVAESAAVGGWRRWGGARLASERVGGSASRHGNSGRRRLPCTPLLLRRGRLPPRSESPLGKDALASHFFRCNPANCTRIHNRTRPGGEASNPTER